MGNRIHVGGWVALAVCSACGDARTSFSPDAGLTDVQATATDAAPGVAPDAGQPDEGTSSSAATLDTSVETNPVATSPNDASAGDPSSADASPATPDSSWPNSQSTQDSTSASTGADSENTPDASSEGSSEAEALSSTSVTTTLDATKSNQSSTSSTLSNASSTTAGPEVEAGAPDASAVDDDAGASSSGVATTSDLDTDSLVLTDAGSPDASISDASADDASADDASADAASADDASADAADAMVADADNPAALLDAGDASPPTTLTALQVIGGSYGLKPAFDPAIKRYSIVANSASAVLSLVAVAGSLSTVDVNGSPVATGETISLDGVAPGSDITIDVGSGPGRTQYLIRYLPPSFPNLVVTQSAPGASTDPLYVNMTMAGVYYATILDNNGVPLFYKREAQRIYDIKKHLNGQVSYALSEDPNVAGSSQIVLDADYQEVARMKAVGLTNTDHHEFLILPNGNYVFVSYERATRDLSAFGGGAAEEVQDSVFQEVNPAMQVVFQWNSWEHFQYDESYYAFSPTDYAHANSVFVDNDGHWLASFRGFSQILKIHRTTGEVIWRLGGLSSDFTFINDPYNGTCGQHTASSLPNGNLLVFDNGAGCRDEVMGSRTGSSRVVEYALDEEAKTAELVWSYNRPELLANAQGGAQRLDNGNTMIGWGNGPSVLATEVDENGNVVFEIEARPRTGRAECYRARRFAD